LKGYVLLIVAES